MLWITSLFREGTARVGLGEARSSRDMRVSPYASCACPEQCVGELPSVVKRPAIEAREQRRLHSRAKALQSRQLSASCALPLRVYVQYSRCMRGLLLATILLRRASGLVQQTLRPVRLQSRQQTRRPRPAVLSR